MEARGFMTEEDLERFAYLAAWAAGRADVRGLAIFGSYARGDAGPGSDVDIKVLTDDPGRFRVGQHWLREIAFDSGVVTVSAADKGDWRQVVARLEDGLDMEFSISALDWAGTDPVSPGAVFVLSKGLEPLYDPDRLFANLLTSWSFGKP